MTSHDLVGRLLELPDIEAQKRFLAEHVSPLGDHIANALKEQANRFLRTAVQRSLEMADLLSYLTELTGNSLYRALALLVDANARSIGGLGEHQRAVELYDKAAEIYQAHDLLVEQAKTQVGKVFSLAMLGRYDDALETGHWTSQVLEEHCQWRPLVNLTMNLAVVHGRQREDAKALAQFDRARALCHELGPDGVPLLQLVEHNRAVVLRNLGQFQASIQAGHAAWELADQLGRKAEIGRVQQNLAFTYLLQGRYNEALKLLDQARDIFLSDGRQSDAVLVELVISDCLLQLRRFNDVLDKCRQLRNLFTELGTRREKADAILNEALACAGLQRYAEALALLAEARHLFEQEGNHVRVACTDLEIAAVLYHQDRLEESLMTAQVCARAFQTHDLPVQEAQAYLSAARAAAALNRHRQATQLVTRALAVGRHKDIPSLVFQCHHLLGSLAWARGNRQEALVEYDQAIQELERLRGRLMVEFRADFLEDKQVIYEDVVALCLDLEQPVRSLEYAERAKSRALLDLLAYRLDLSIQTREPRDGPLVEELLHLRAERDRLYRRWEANEGFSVRGGTPSTGTRQQVRQDVLALERRISNGTHPIVLVCRDRAAGIFHRPR
jgi:tetratricopeptide (TPR) repeat protein